MVAAIEDELASRVGRRLIICDPDAADRAGPDGSIWIGNHPLPTTNSVAAATELVNFLHAGPRSDSTVFAVSGGASSLCNLPQAPVTLSDLEELWGYALRSGVDITTLNRLRAATSQIAGGRILRHVRTATSLSLILVDNVVSGARWVASGLTYDATFVDEDVNELLDRFGVTDSALRMRVVESSRLRSDEESKSNSTDHRNVVLADPSLMLRAALATAAWGQP